MAMLGVVLRTVKVPWCASCWDLGKYWWGGYHALLAFFRALVNLSPLYREVAWNSVVDPFSRQYAGNLLSGAERL